MTIRRDSPVPGGDKMTEDIPRKDMTVNQQATPVYVMTVLRDNTLEQCRVFAEYEDAYKAANDLAFKMWGDNINFLVQDPPSFLGNECWHVGGIKIGIEMTGIVAANEAAE